MRVSTRRLSIRTEAIQRAREADREARSLARAPRLASLRPASPRDEEEREKHERKRGERGNERDERDGTRANDSKTMQLFAITASVRGSRNYPILFPLLVPPALDSLSLSPLSSPLSLSLSMLHSPT